MSFKKIASYLKNNLVSILLVIFIVVMFFVGFYDLKYKMAESGSFIKKIYLVYSVLLAFLLFIYLMLKNKIKELNDYNIPRIFVITSVIFGSIFLFSSPMFSGSDEHNHYYRIYEITEGVFVTPTSKYVGSKLPESLEKTFEMGSGNNATIKYKQIKSMLNIKLDEKNKKQYGDKWVNSYNNTALYSPVQYFPEIIGFMIGKILKLNPYIIGMFGRIFNLLFYIFIGYIALKNVPKSKLFYLFILISPNLLQCATTLSADAFTNVIFLLLIALIFKEVNSDYMISKKSEVILLILSIIISLCKIVYLPVIFLLFLLKNDKFKKGKKGKILFIILTLVMCCSINLIWTGLTTNIFKVAYDKTELQKNFIFSHIFEYFIIFIRTFCNQFSLYIENLFVGTTMYHSQLHMPSFISFLYVFIVLIALLKEKTNFEIKKYSKYLIGVISVIIIGLIGTAIYIQCTAQFVSIGNSIIVGIQGRYFIPIIILLPFLLPKFNVKFNIKNIDLYNILIGISIVTILFIFVNFVL